jgi:cytochrome c oxidase subunit 4
MASQTVQKGKTQLEGPGKHVLAYVLSLVLTAIAFAIVLFGGLSKGVVITILLLLAFIQAIVQIMIWMHVKDKGHLFPILGLILGAVIAATLIIMATVWMWW